MKGKMPGGKFRFLTMLCAALSLAGCVSLVEKTGQALDGSAFKEKKIARWKTPKPGGMEVLEAQNKAGEASLVISLADFPAIKIRGTGPDAEGKFWVKSLEYLSGNVSGWNEFSMELSGEGNFLRNGSEAVFSIMPELEKVQISAGKIRLNDTRITGNEAQSNLRNRAERIASLAEWMAEYEAEQQSFEQQSSEQQSSASRKAFARYWKATLFPEICAKQKRPPAWQEEGDVWVRANSIKWNQSYTTRLLPEELRPVRDSGTLLRDWEEAFEWIYLQHEWGKLIERLSYQTTLYRVK